MGQSADDISMANLLGQLLFVTEQFDMEMQPQLMLLQKTMVVVEGVGRTLDPHLNMWIVSEPVVEEWMKSKLGPEARLNDAVEGAAAIGKLVEHFPEFLSGAEKAVNLLSSLTLNEGFKQEQYLRKSSNETHNRNEWTGTTALWIGALALVVIATAQLFG
jgi:ubiquinone biosynthesis protein